MATTGSNSTIKCKLSLLSQFFSYYILVPPQTLRDNNT